LSNQRRAFYEGYTFESTPFSGPDCIYVNRRIDHLLDL
jgi:hypothetical protein